MLFGTDSRCSLCDHRWMSDLHCNAKGYHNNSSVHTQKQVEPTYMWGTSAVIKYFVQWKLQFILVLNSFHSRFYHKNIMFVTLQIHLISSLSDYFKKNFSLLSGVCFVTLQIVISTTHSSHKITRKSRIPWNALSYTIWTVYVKLQRKRKHMCAYVGKLSSTNINVWSGKFWIFKCPPLLQQG